MKDRKKIMLALQGGGAHTAYVWGVVDRLLADDEFEIVGVSGTSGGAMVAAVLAFGLSMETDAAGQPLDDVGRRRLARDLLRRFWEYVSELGDRYWNPYRFVANPLHPSWNIDGLPVPTALNMLTSLASPYQSPLGRRHNPVSSAIADCIDFRALNKSRIGPALYVCATNVRTNQPMIFIKPELTLEHLLASACLPFQDRAIEIETSDGGIPVRDFYWDGGYTADPSLAPLIRNHAKETADLVIVGVNPIVRSAATMPPKTAWEILDRMNEITFNSSLLGEIDRIHTINALIDEVPADAPACRAGGRLHDKRKILIHYVPPHAAMEELGVASKSNTALPFLRYLHELGSGVATAWLAGETAGGGAPRLGVASDSNLAKLFIDPYNWRAAPLRKGRPAAAAAPAVTRVAEPAVKAKAAVKPTAKSVAAATKRTTAARKTTAKS